MTIGMIRAGSVALLCVMGCGGSRAKVDEPSAGVGGVTDAGTTDAASRAERPMANSVLEAQTMIQSQIDGHIKTLWKCVEDYRTKKGDPHKAVAIDVGIDQEGALLGVTSANPKQELDPGLRDCLFTALRGLPFPRSHAGVITVRQTFQDTTVYQ